MKKIILPVTVALSIFLISCKKEYVCECTTTAPNYSASSTVTTNNGTIVTRREISKTSKSTAEAICSNYTQTSNSYYNQQGVTYTYSETDVTVCDLK